MERGVGEGEVEERVEMEEALGIQEEWSFTGTKVLENWSKSSGAER